MTVISRYIFKQVASATAVVLLVVFGLDIIFRLANELQQQAGNYTLSKALFYVLLGSPLQFYSVMPLIAMIGCLVGLGSLASSSELVVLRSTGLSTTKLTWIAMKPTFVFLISAVLIGEFIAPRSEMMADNLKTLAKSGSNKIDLKKRFWLRDDNRFVYVNSLTPHQSLIGVHLFSFNNEQKLTKIEIANTAEFTGKHWLLTDVQTTYFVGDGKTTDAIKEEHLHQVIWDTSIKPELLKVAIAQPRDLPMRELFKYSQYLESQSLNPIEYQLAFWEKVFYPFMVISLILVGIAFIFGPLRQVTMGFRLFCGVMVGVLVKTLQTAVGPFSMVFDINPVFAMAIPSIITALIGLYLLSKVR
ncbi:MAG: LPS export ABC transporter permease LptG [Cellvibrionales bacterium]|nr:LPS export ABC transporter permease LptG [Cellvibrionales bacterium]